MLKNLIEKYGKEKLNTMTKFPSILTMHSLGDKGRLLPTLTTPIESEVLTATEKIDGTNSRIICYGDEYIIGSREFLLHHCDDMFYDNAQGIVDGIKELSFPIPKTAILTVIYGEFYGGKVSSNSKQYGQDKVGFRVFAIAEYADLSILEKSREEISRWRERETENGIVYGQSFLTRKQIETTYPEFQLVPIVEFDCGDFTIETIYNNMKKAIPETNVALSASALKRPEGLVLSNEDRSKVVKIRFEDYEKTLNIKHK